MDYQLEKLRAARDSAFEEGVRTPVYLVLQSARGYQGLSTSWDGLQQAVTQTLAELDEILRLAEEDDRWTELCDETTQVLQECTQEAQVPDLIATLEQLEAEFLELDLTACYARLEEGQAWSRVASSLDFEIPEWELTAGHYTLVLAAMEEWLEGVSPVAFLEEQLERTHAQLAEYAGAYLAPEEWTYEVATADQLLQEGLECWVQGLTRLREAVVQGQPGSVPRGLELLLGGNHKLIQVERLASLATPS